MQVNNAPSYYVRWSSFAHREHRYFTLGIDQQSNFASRLLNRCVKLIILDSILLIERIEFAVSHVLYHKHNFAAAQAFEAGLKDWEGAPYLYNDRDNRAVAAAKIRRAYYRKSSQLDLSWLSLKSLPPQLGMLSHLKELHLWGNTLTSLPEEIGNLKNLVLLNCNNNKFLDFPSCVCEISSLKHLDFAHNGITSFPDAMGRLASLEYLDLSSNTSLKVLPRSIFMLAKLKELVLVNNQIAEIPAEIENLTSLESLELTRNRISHLPETFVKLASLKKLELSQNALDTFPSQIPQLTHLRELYLGWNRIEEIPSSIGNLEHLKILSLYCNRLRRLPMGIGSLSMLEKLNVSNNKLESFPNIAPLQCLSVISVEDNWDLTDVPDWVILVPKFYWSKTRINRGTVMNRRRQMDVRIPIPRLISIVVEKFFMHIAPYLYLGYWFRRNGLSRNTFIKWRQFEANLNEWVNDPNVKGSKVKAAAAIRDAIRVNELNLINLELTELPSAITYVKDIHLLRLGGNQLTDLPIGIENLTKLTYLDVEHNKFENLPEAIFLLIRLRLLNVLNNRLRTLSASIGNLRFLMHLYLESNYLIRLTPTLGNLRQLQVLWIGENPQLVEIPLSLGNSDLKDLSSDRVLRDQAEHILEMCAASRVHNDLVHFPVKIQVWKDHAEKVGDRREFDLDFLNEFSDVEKSTIIQWLLRLSTSKDFETRQAQLAYKVCAMLETLKTNEPFREYFFGQVRGNLVGCGDRAAMSFNELYSCWIIYTMPSETPLKEKLGTLASFARAAALRVILTMLIDKHEKEEKRIQQESVEIYLYYENHLKTLKLLSVVEDTLFSDMGKRDWINEELLIKFVEDNYLSFMADNSLISDLALKDKQFTESWKIQEDKFTVDMEELDDNSEALGSGKFTEESKKLIAEKDSAFKSLLIQWIEEKINN